MRNFLLFRCPVLYFCLRPDLITVLLLNNLTRLQFMIILYWGGISDWSQHSQDVNALLSDMKWITVPSWLTYKQYVSSMKTATTDLICLRQFESPVLFSPIFYFQVCFLFVFRLKETLVSWNSKELIMQITSRLHHFTFLSHKSTKSCNDCSISRIRSRITAFRFLLNYFPLVKLLAYRSIIESHGTLSLILSPNLCPSYSTKTDALFWWIYNRPGEVLGSETRGPISRHILNRFTGKNQFLFHESKLFYQSIQCPINFVL